MILLVNPRHCIPRDPYISDRPNGRVDNADTVNLFDRLREFSSGSSKSVNFADKPPGISRSVEALVILHLRRKAAILDQASRFPILDSPKPRFKCLFADDLLFS